MKLSSSLELILFSLLLALVRPAVKADTVLNIVLRPRYYNGSEEVSSALCDNAIPPYLHLNIVLAPPNATSQQGSPMCGLDSSIDPSRFLGELNVQMVFDLLDQSKDPNPVYKTRVIEVLKFNNSDGPVHSSRTEDESGLFSLFIAPPTAECNEQVLEIATASETEYYPVYVSNSGNFTQQVDSFISEAACLRKHHYQGKSPKLCGTVTPMKQQSADAINENLLSIFNFPYNDNRSTMLKLKEQSCKTTADTVNALKNSEAFEKTSDAAFESNVYSAVEADEFVEVSLVRNSTVKKGIIWIETSFPETNNSASAEDMRPYSGPLVFKEGDRTASLFLQVKLDTKVEEIEVFDVHIKDLPIRYNRRKRYNHKKQNARINIQDSPPNDCTTGLPVEAQKEAAVRIYPTDFDPLTFDEEGTSNRRSDGHQGGLTGYTLIGYRGISFKHRKPDKCRSWFTPTIPPGQAMGAHQFLGALADVNTILPDEDETARDKSDPEDDGTARGLIYVSTRWTVALDYAQDTAFNLACDTEGKYAETKRKYCLTNNRTAFENSGAWKQFASVFRVYAPNNWVKNSKTIIATEPEPVPDGQEVDEGWQNRVDEGWQSRDLRRQGIRKRKIVFIQSRHSPYNPDTGKGHQILIKPEDVGGINEVILINAENDF